MTVHDVLVDLVTLNKMRAVHKRKVYESLYSKQSNYDKGEKVEGTVADWVVLNEEENKIIEFEDHVAKNVASFDVPDWLSVKQYAELISVSTSTVYRRIKQGNILAEKVQGRWRIYTNIDLIEEVA